MTEREEHPGVPYLEQTETTDVAELDENQELEQGANLDEEINVEPRTKLRTCYKAASRIAVDGLRAVIVFGGTTAGLMIASQTEFGDNDSATNTEMQLRPVPSLDGGTYVDAGFIGGIKVDTHDGPIQNRIKLTSINGEKLVEYIEDPDVSPDIDQEAKSFGSAAGTVLPKAIIGSLTGLAVATAGGILLERNMEGKTTRKAAGKWLPQTALPALFLVSSGSIAATSIDTDITSDDIKFEGLIATMPDVQTKITSIIDNYENFNEQMIKATQYLGELNHDLEGLRVVGEQEQHILLAGDFHNTPGSIDIILETIRNPNYNVRFVLLNGDFVDNGTSLENALLDDIDKIEVPVVAVKGNHDSAETMQLLEDKGVIVLNNDVVEIGGQTILGVADPRLTLGQDLSLKNRDEVFAREADELEEHARVVVKSLTDYYQPDIILASHPASLQYVRDSGAKLMTAGNTHDYEVASPSEGTLYVNPGSLGGAGLRASNGDNERTFALVGLEKDTLASITKIGMGGFDENLVEVCRNGQCSHQQFCTIEDTAIDCHDDDDEEPCFTYSTPEEILGN